MLRKTLAAACIAGAAAFTAPAALPGRVQSRVRLHQHDGCTLPRTDEKLLSLKVPASCASRAR